MTAGHHNVGCPGCREGEGFLAPISMAFQPIVDLKTRSIWAYEALVRGPRGEPAASVLRLVTPNKIYSFDQRCRVTAIQTAVAAGILQTDAKLSINFLPNAVYSPRACIQLTLQTAATVGLPADRLIFEFTETEQMGDPSHVTAIVKTYQEIGFRTALDDFGSGFANLSLLSRFRPDLIKLDMDLIRGVDADLTRQHIVKALVGLAKNLDMRVVAEGIETVNELRVVQQLGIDLAQGYFLAKPAFERLPSIEGALG
ncbi:EAL domain-containing protein [Xanthobacteraceae bacterium A53D]